MLHKLNVLLKSLNICQLPHYVVQKPRSINLDKFKLAKYVS